MPDPLTDQQKDSLHKCIEFILEAHARIHRVYNEYPDTSLEEILLCLEKTQMNLHRYLTSA